MTDDSIQHNAIRKFLAFLNDNCEYVILRNWSELLDEDIISSHKDIDILTSNKDVFIEKTQAKPVYDNNHRNNYTVVFDGESIRVDIRYIGDGYFPAELERELLANKVLYNGMFYIPSSEPYFYSLAYHAVLQKRQLSEEYTEKLSCVYRELYCIDTTLSETDLLHILRRYLKGKNMKIEIPADPCVRLCYRKIGKEYVRFSIIRIWRRFYYRLSTFLKRIL